MKCSKSCSICENEYDNCIECNYDNELILNIIKMELTLKIL